MSTKDKKQTKNKDSIQEDATFGAVARTLTFMRTNKKTHCRRVVTQSVSSSLPPPYPLSTILC